MNHWMRTRTIRMVGLLFGLSLMLTACDAEDLLALLDGSLADQNPVAEAPADDDAAEDVDAAEDAGDRAGTDEGDAVDGKSESREFQCREDGVRKARKADAENAGDDPAADEGDEAPAKAPADGGGANDSDATDGGDAPAGSDAAPARKPKPAPDEPAPSGGNSGGSSGNLSAIEQDIFDRLNATRREAGLDALTLSAEISRGARSWSCDMAASGNFRHADLRAAGVYGENIAWGQRSAAEVHQGWMNSPGHRDNRMSSRWTEYGVGVCNDSSGRLYYTERFR
jgi:uncharacterized protein YkwD